MEIQIELPDEEKTRETSSIIWPPFRRLAVLLFWLGFCFLLEEVGDRADSINAATYDSHTRK